MDFYSGDSQHVTNNLQFLYYRERIEETMEMENEEVENLNLKGK